MFLQIPAKNPRTFVNSLILAAAVFCLHPAMLVAQESSEADSSMPFSESIDVDIINVEVFVTDKKGNPVKGLKAEDFELRESGEIIAVSNFYAVEDGERLTQEIGSIEGEAGLSVAAPQKIDPMFLIVYVDNSLLQPFSRTKVLGELRDFLKERQENGDHIMLVSFDGGRLRVLSQFTRTWRPLKAAINELMNSGSLKFHRDDRYRDVISEMLMIRAARSGGPGGRAGGATQPSCPPEMMIPGRFYAQSRRDEILRSIDHLERFVKELSGFPGRKAILHVSDGLPQVPGMEIFEYVYRLCGGGGVADGLRGRDSRFESPTGAFAHMAQLDSLEFDVADELENLTDHANANNVTFFAFEGAGPRVFEGSAQGVSMWHVDQARVADMQNGLFFLADETGGRAFFNLTNLDQPLKRLEEDLGTYYSLGYESRFDDLREHRIKIKVPGLDVRVRHRKSSRAKSKLKTLEDRTNGALMFQLVDNPLGVDLEVGEAFPMDDKLHLVPIRLDIPLSSLAFLPEEGARKGKVTLYLAALDREGRKAPVRTAEVPITIPEEDFESAQEQMYFYEVKMLMRPGDHSVAVGVHDDYGSSASYLLEDVVVAKR